MPLTTGRARADATGLALLPMLAASPSKHGGK
jgi:hypothetical protein